MPKTAVSNHLVNQLGINGCTIEVMNNKTKAAKDVIYCLVNTYTLHVCMTAYIIWMIILNILWMMINNVRRCPGP
jgi:hypothetical protein